MKEKEQQEVQNEEKKEEQKNRTPLKEEGDIWGEKGNTEDFFIWQRLISL